MSQNYDKDEGSSIVIAEKKRLQELREKSKLKESCILFFCKDCKKVVEVNRPGKRYVYECNICKTKNVAFGTEASINKFFHIKDGERV